MHHLGPGGHDDNTPPNKLFIHAGSLGQSSSLFEELHLHPPSIVSFQNF